MRILIVEDEEDMLYAVKKGLKGEGYAIDLALDGNEALEMIEYNHYDCIILDINLPKINGFKVLEIVRQQNQDVKVIILSANAEIDDRVKGLDIGANDYIVKPFHLKELKARLRALLRRQFVNLDSIFEFGNLKLDSTNRNLLWEDKVVSLTNKEFGILEYLIIHKDKYISSEELIEHIWNEEGDLFSNTIRVHIHSLRKKLYLSTGFDSIIETQPSIGYKFNSKFEEVGNE